MAEMANSSLILFSPFKKCFCSMIQIAALDPWTLKKKITFSSKVRSARFPPKFDQYVFLHISISTFYYTVRLATVSSTVRLARFTPQFDQQRFSPQFNQHVYSNVWSATVSATTRSARFPPHLFNWKKITIRQLWQCRWTLAKKRLWAYTPIVLEYQMFS